MNSRAARKPRAPHDEWWQTAFDSVYDDFAEQLRPTFQIEADVRVISVLLGRHGVAGGSLLDAPCGGGRHMCRLAAQGFRVHGVDFSRDMLARAHERVSEWGVAGNCGFTQADLRTFSTTDCFDAAINWHLSLGYTCKDEDDVLMLGSIGRTLRDGGILLIESDHLPHLHRTWVERGTIPLRGGEFRFSRTLGDDGVFVQHTYQAPDGSPTSYSRFQTRICTIEQLCALVAAAGLEVAETVAGDGVTPAHDDDRVIVVARAIDK